MHYEYQFHIGIYNRKCYCFSTNNNANLQAVSVMTFVTTYIITKTKNVYANNEKGVDGTMEIRKLLINEMDRLENIAKKVGEKLSDVPQGTLRVAKSNGCVQYYHRTEEGKHNGCYIQKKDMELARRLAQKEYDEKVFVYANKTSAQIRRLLKTYEDNGIENIFNSEHEARKRLICPVEEPFENCLRSWINEPFVGKGFKETSPVIITNSGIRVRSKSEKIMSDYFDSVGLMYKYECPLILNPYGIIYPDFTFLSRKTRKLIYWEHEGMIDNPEYAQKAVQKIELYEKNGIFPGENLILTFETATNAINTDILKLLTQKYLL